MDEDTAGLRELCSSRILAAFNFFAVFMFHFLMTTYTALVLHVALLSIDGLLGGMVKANISFWWC